jgi:hypothetical protein
MLGKTSRNACFASIAVAMQGSKTSDGQSLHNKFLSQLDVFNNHEI